MVRSKLVQPRVGAEGLASSQNGRLRNLVVVDLDEHDGLNFATRTPSQVTRQGVAKHRTENCRAESLSDDRDDHRVVVGAAKDAMDPNWTERCEPLMKTKMTKMSSKFVKMASASKSVKYRLDQS